MQVLFKSQVFCTPIIIRDDIIFNSKTFQICVLILAAEAMYALPFQLPRFFRYELLTFFGVCREEFAEAQSWYGVFAALGYIPGGLLTEIFSPKKLIIASLLATALSGFLLFFIHGMTSLIFVYSFWGVSTVLFFWSAYITVVRSVSKENEQGRTFGLVEFGRGLIAAICVTSLNFLVLNTGAINSASSEKNSLYPIISFYIVVIVASAFFCMITLKDKGKIKATEKTSQKKSLDFNKMKSIFSNASVWCSLFLILFAYSAFKATDYYAFSLKENFSLSGTHLAYLVTGIAWIRPFAALFFGFLGDKLNPSRSCLICCVLVLAPSLLIYIIPAKSLSFWNLIFLIFLQLNGIFGLRGVYFALFREAKVKKSDTGATTGFISFLGYTPDFFLPLVAFSVMENHPGAAGFQNFMLFIACLSFLGLIATMKIAAQKRTEEQEIPKEEICKSPYQLTYIGQRT